MLISISCVIWPQLCMHAAAACGSLFLIRRRPTQVNSGVLRRVSLAAAAPPPRRSGGSCLFAALSSARTLVIFLPRSTAKGCPWHRFPINEVGGWSSALMKPENSRNMSNNTCVMRPPRVFARTHAQLQRKRRSHRLLFCSAFVLRCFLARACAGSSCNARLGQTRLRGSSRPGETSWRGTSARPTRNDSRRTSPTRKTGE